MLGDVADLNRSRVCPEVRWENVRPDSLRWESLNLTETIHGGQLLTMLKDSLVDVVDRLVDVVDRLMGLVDTILHRPPLPPGNESD